jgi:hypothetical protein
MGEDQVKIRARGQAKVSLSSFHQEPSAWITIVTPLDPETPNGPQIETSALLTFHEAWEFAQQILALVAD